MNAASQIRVVSVHGPDDVRVGTASFPEVGENDVLVQMHACGVCGSDVHYVKHGGSGMEPTKEPMPIGHEGSGEIVAVGSAVAKVREGDRVIINPMASAAIIGNGGPEGAFSDYLLVRDAASTESLLSIPPAVSYADAALAEPLAVSLRAVNRAGAMAGETAVVFGAGPIGLGIVLWLKRKGVKDVIAIDFSARRLELAKAMGADHVIDARIGDAGLAAEITARHGAADVFGAAVCGTDMYFDAAGAPPVLNSVFTLAKSRCRFVIVAMHFKPVTWDVMPFMSKEMMMTGSVGYHGELADALAALPEIADLARQMVTDTYAFDNVLDGLRRAADTNSGKVLIEFSPA